MDNDKKTNQGAPSSDTTSALFVSARKKQLEELEKERRAKEREEERLKAEAEVRRLEAEVEMRKQRAEEEALKIAQEEQLRETDGKKTRRFGSEQGSEGPYDGTDGYRGQLGSGAYENKEVMGPNRTKEDGGQGGFLQKVASFFSIKDENGQRDKKKVVRLGIAGGGTLLALLLVIILVFTLAGGQGKETPDDHSKSLDQEALGEGLETYNENGFSFMYPTEWTVTFDQIAKDGGSYEDGFDITIQSDYTNNEAKDTILMSDITNDIFLGDYAPDITGENILMEVMNLFAAEADTSTINPAQVHEENGFAVGQITGAIGVGDGIFQLHGIIRESGGRQLLGFIFINNYDDFETAELVYRVASEIISGTVLTGGPYGGNIDQDIGDDPEIDEEPYVEINPDAPLDAHLKLPTLGMKIGYPSETFTVYEDNDLNVQLALGDTAAISIFSDGEALSQKVRTSKEQMLAVEKASNDGMVAGFLANQSNINIISKGEESQKKNTYQYVSVISYRDSESGRDMYLLWRTAIWENTSNKNIYLYHFVVSAELERSEEILQIYKKMLKGLKDI